MTIQCTGAAHKWVRCAECHAASFIFSWRWPYRFRSGNLLAGGTAPIDLGTSADFGALAGGAISGTGNVDGDVGSGTGAIAPAITSTGTIYPTGDAVVMTALTDFATAFDEGKNRPHDVLLSAAAFELGGSTLTPGVYKIGAAATLASPVTLDAEGDPDAVFIIQIVGALGATAVSRKRAFNERR